MTKYHKFIYLICAMLIFQTAPLYLQAPNLKFDHISTKTKQPEPKNNEYTPEGQQPISEVQLASNWVARGGCWDFSNKIFVAQGIRGSNKAYYKKKNFKNFTYEVRLMKLAEDGTIGLILRYNEAKDEGYLFHVWPHGDYQFLKFKTNDGVILKKGHPIHFNRELNTWNIIKIVCNEDKFNIYINGDFLASIKDVTYSIGKTGLFIGGDPRQRAKFEVISLFKH